MKLTIITINFNNAEGLHKTMESVLAQTSRDFEYIVVDGASTDSSCQVINELISDQRLVISDEFKNGDEVVNGIPVRWVSEPDLGIYNAMNKGIRMAKGEYVQFLNSGDILASNDVTERMLSQINSEDMAAKQQEDPSIFYGNMLKDMPKGLLRDKGFAGRQPTMQDFYTGTLNHSPAYIPRILFERYGTYDEDLKIVSDWKWYLEVIIFHSVSVRYVDVDVTLFDMSGISNSNRSLELEERNKVLQKLLVKGILNDYEVNTFLIDQVQRINRYKLIKTFFYLVERLLFQWEKRKNNSYIQ
jgi:glycosyltransferase involved in cell wall biosynthesis